MYELYGMGSMRIAGGEPIIYPGFLALLNELGNIFVVEVSTNLSLPWERIVDQVEPLNIKFHTSFHPEYSQQDVFFG